MTLKFAQREFTKAVNYMGIDTPENAIYAETILPLESVAFCDANIA